MSERRTISRVKPDATALRALAHPQRLRMLGMLRVDGPATATSLAARLGLNSGATSYHLRQLAKHGFITEDEERGNARDRWWRAQHESTVFLTDEDDPEDMDAGMAFAQAALTAHVGQMQQALDRRAELSVEWRKASTINDFTIPLNAAEAEALTEKVRALLWEAMERAPKLGDVYEPGVKPVTFIFHAFPQMQENSEA